MTEHEQQIIAQAAADWKFLDRAPVKEPWFVNFYDDEMGRDSCTMHSIDSAALQSSNLGGYQFTIVISPDGSTRIIHLQDVGRQMLDEREAEQAADDAHVRGLVERGIAGND